MFNYEGTKVKLKIAQEAKPINTSQKITNNQKNKEIIHFQ